MPGFEKKIITEARKFLVTNELINEDLRKKYIERISLCSKIRKHIDSLFYENVKIDLHCKNYEDIKKQYKDILLNELKKKISNFKDAKEQKVLIEYREIMYEKYKDMVLGSNDQTKLKSYIDISAHFLGDSIITEPRYLNDYCPYCFKNKNGKSILEKKDTKYKNNLKNLKKKYSKEIGDIINKYKIEDNIDLRNYYSKECNHFFHEECIKKKNDKEKHICLYCEDFIHVKNIILFENLRFELIYLTIIKFTNDELYLESKKKLENEPKKYKDILFEETQFFLKYNEYINKDIREKYSKRIDLCKEFHKIDPYKYNFQTIKLNGEDFNEKNMEYKFLMEERRREEEEEEEEEENYNRISFSNYDSNRSEYSYKRPQNSSSSKQRLSLSTCKGCINRCLNCGTDKSIGLLSLFAHKECYPKKAKERRCYICSAHGVPLYYLSNRLCNRCNREFGYRLFEKCFFCGKKF